jgi:hypothetical protein
MEQRSEGITTANVYFRSTRHIKTAMAGTAARAGDATVTTGLETWTTGAAGKEDNGWG